jgi:hypothetical protein
MDAKVVRSGMLAGMFGGAVMAMWSMLVLVRRWTAGSAPGRWCWAWRST